MELERYNKFEQFVNLNHGGLVENLVRSINVALSVLVAYDKFTPTQLADEIKRLHHVEKNILPEIVEHCAFLVMLDILKSDISWQLTKKDTFLGFRKKKQIRLATAKLTSKQKTFSNSKGQVHDLNPKADH